MSILNADGQEIYKQIETSELVLVDCWAPWCSPCRMIAVVLEEIDQEIDLKIVKVNSDENEDFINNYQVLGVPTLLLFQNGELVKRITGFKPKASLLASLKEWVG